MLRIVKRYWRMAGFAIILPLIGGLGDCTEFLCIADPGLAQALGFACGIPN